MDEIKERQEKIIEEFSLLDNDLEMTLGYIIELGGELNPYPEKDRIDDNLIKGCQSKVWMTANLQENLVVFDADSNTSITKGLASLLVRTLNRLPAQKIIDAPIYFPEQIGMDRFIGTQRSNGFLAMIKQMKYYALALNKNE